MAMCGFQETFGGKISGVCGQFLVMGGRLHRARDC